MFEEKYQLLLRRIKKEYGEIGELVASDLRLESMIELFSTMETTDFENFKEFVLTAYQKDFEFLEKGIDQCLEGDALALYDKIEEYLNEENFTAKQEQLEELLQALLPILDQKTLGDGFQKPLKLLKDYTLDAKKDWEQAEVDLTSPESYIQVLKRQQKDLWSKENLEEHSLDSIEIDQLMRQLDLTKRFTSWFQKFTKNMEQLALSKQLDKPHFHIPTDFKDLKSVLNKIGLIDLEEKYDREWYDIVEKYQTEKENVEEINKALSDFTRNGRDMVFQFHDLRAESNLPFYTRIYRSLCDIRFGSYDKNENPLTKRQKGKNVRRMAKKIVEESLLSKSLEVLDYELTGVDFGEGVDEKKFENIMNQTIEELYWLEDVCASFDGASLKDIARVLKSDLVENNLRNVREKISQVGRLQPEFNFIKTQNEFFAKRMADVKMLQTEEEYCRILATNQFDKKQQIPMEDYLKEEMIKKQYYQVLLQLMGPSRSRDDWKKGFLTPAYKTYFEEPRREAETLAEETKWISGDENADMCLKISQMVLEARRIEDDDILHHALENPKRKGTAPKVLQKVATK